MSYKVSKYHGLGNDYIVLDYNENDLLLTEDNIKLLCDRHYGVGSDGILYGPIFEDDKIKLKIYNPDGSEAEKSGNGVRIFARYLLDEGYVKDGTVTLETLGGRVEIDYLRDNLIKVLIGKASFMSDTIPVTGSKREVVNEMMIFNSHEYRVSCVSVGNPHCVLLMDEISSDIAKELGPIIEIDGHFPRRINVQFMKIIDRSNIQIEIYERGAGYTLASGTSSCAAAVVARKLDLIDSKVIVHMPGGELKVEIMPDDNIYLIGPVSKVCDVILSEELTKEMKGFSYIKKKGNRGWKKEEEQKY